MLEPSSLEQMFFVLRTFKLRYSAGDDVEEAYRGAVDQASRHFGVTYQTIGDLCRRRLGLAQIDEFYGLLRQWVSGSSMQLRDLIKRYTEPAYHCEIDSFFWNREPR